MSSTTTSIGLISDTHGWVHPYLATAFEEVNYIVHAGDIGNTSVLDDLENIAPVHAVRGNIDGGALYDLPLVRTLDVGKRKLAVLHIAGSPKRPKRAALDVLRKQRPDILVVGHSHIWVVSRVMGTLWINPGAAGRHGFHIERTAAILHIDQDGGITMDRVELGKRGEGRR